MPSDQGVEEVPQGSQGLVLGRAVPGELVDEAAGEAGRHPGELEGLQLAPGEKATHDPGVGAAGVGIGDPGGEQRLRAGPLEDCGDRSGRIKGLRSGQKSSLRRG